MSMIPKESLAGICVSCGLFVASAVSADSLSSQWLKDGSCAVFNADAQPGDTVSWTGDCVDGYASGLGTATFTHNGQSQSYSAQFAHGQVLDGHVITKWGGGWSYDGEITGGRFNGAGVLTTNTGDRFEGHWVDGKLNGHGVLLRSNGERYSGEWKDNKPNGTGELRRPDGTVLSGQFADGKLVQLASSPPAKDASTQPPNPSRSTFDGVSGKTLTAVDGSAIALNVIEGGLELQVIPADGHARKTTFTFMTDRMGTVVEDTGQPGAGTAVTGFFRLTPKGVEIRYADGRSAMLSASGDGGVEMVLDSDTSTSCRSWYPAGHVFSEAEKKIALNAYARKLGLPTPTSDNGGCVAESAAISPTSAHSVAQPIPRARPEKRSDLKSAPTHIAKASYRIGDDSRSVAELKSIDVRTSEIHQIDGPDTTALASPAVTDTLATARIASNPADTSHCLSVDSDGSHWGFRNSCDFALQFSYCMSGSNDSLARCGSGVVSGSVAPKGFGALISDNSLKESDAVHNFRWIACRGGAGEVVAHLDQFEPPSGRCERAGTASAN